MSKWQYSIRDYGHRFDIDVDDSFDQNDGEIVASVAAADFHNEHDGWEHQWPIMFTIYLDGKSLGTFDVEMDVEPVFTVSERE